MVTDDGATHIRRTIAPHRHRQTRLPADQSTPELLGNDRVLRWSDCSRRRIGRDHRTHTNRLANGTSVLASRFRMVGVPSEGGAADPPG